MTSKQLRDVVLITAPAVLAMAIFVLGQGHIPENWLAPAAFGTNFLLQIAVKAFVPDHQPLRFYPWPYLLLVIALAMALLILANNWSLLGWFTPLALFVIALILLSVSVVAALTDKKDDATPPND